MGKLNEFIKEVKPMLGADYLLVSENGYYKIKLNKLAVPIAFIEEDNENISVYANTVIFSVHGYPSVDGREVKVLENPSATTTGTFLNVLKTKIDSLIR